MLPTHNAAQVPRIITRIAPMAILTGLPATMITVRRHYASKSIFEPDDEEKIRKAKKFQQPADDQPWDGDEPVKHSVLRMIMDKYRAPLRVEGAARRSIPQPQSSYVPSSPPPQKEKSSQKKKIERENKLRELKQNRIMDAKDAAFYYSSERKYPTPTPTPSNKKETTQLGDKKVFTTGKDIDWDDWDTRETPISINDLGVLADARIRSAMVKGQFDHLPGRGKPLKKDPLLNNPFVDTTEHFLNKIIQHNGAAPPWIMMQQEVDADVDILRTQMNTAMKRCVEEIKARRDFVSPFSLKKQFDSLEKSFFEKEVSRVNSRVRSYNVMCPEPVRKPLLELDKELKTVIDKYAHSKKNRGVFY